MMEFTHFLGYLAALVIGLTLGLIGAGGSILTVPILTYLFFINPITATAYSLFIVGNAALVGAISNVKKKLVDFRTTLVFAIPSFIAVYFTRKYLVPAIPDYLFSIGKFDITKEIGVMLFFAIIMVLASASMIISPQYKPRENSKKRYNYSLIMFIGFYVGVVTGIIGAGGGFLIIPALVLLAKLPMKKAVGTSLMIIAIKSLIGFIGDIGNIEIDWLFLILFSLISIIGIFAGVYLSNIIKEKNLKKSFGWFVLILGVFIIIKELSL